MNSNWIHVSFRHPCPICQHTDWCLVSRDGMVCLCHRMKSDRMTKNGGAYIHRLTGDIVPLAPARSPEEIERERREAEARVKAIREGFLNLPQDDIQDRMDRYLETELGLPAAIMKRLDWRWDNVRKVVQMPMRDATGLITGIRTRKLKTGEKSAIYGSKDGLFFDPTFTPLCTEELFVCEGPTDQAAAYAVGAWCVGRSSCNTGLNLIRELMRNNRVRRVTIIADDDPPKPRIGGGTWRPGFEGAMRLAENLGTPYRLIYPPPGFKDIRAWYRTGEMNPESFRRLINSRGWSGPGQDW